VLYLHGAKAADGHRSAFPFSVRPNAKQTHGAQRSTPATQTGALGQSLRHTERLHHLLTDGHEQMSQWSRTVSRENEMLRAAHLKMLEATEALLDRQHERALETRIAQAREARMDRLAEMALPILPAIASAIPALKGVAWPKAAHPLEQDVRGFFASLDESQWEKIMPVLSQEQGATLTFMHRAMIERQDALALPSTEEPQQ